MENKMKNKNFLKNKTILEIKFNTLLSDERREEIRELIEDNQGVEILEIEIIYPKSRHGNLSILEIKFNTLLSDERIEEIRELIEDNQGIEIVEINNNGVLKD
jgi:hypothetical protein|tara:strand:- start:128 stop:436 length:309 start_codon:yes stop_codon:yes gene_type:complete